VYSTNSTKNRDSQYTGRESECCERLREWCEVHDMPHEMPHTYQQEQLLELLLLLFDDLAGEERRQ